MNQAQAAFEAAQKQFGHLVGGLNDIDWEQLPNHVKQHIKQHPKMTAFQIIMLTAAVVPSLVVAPVLGLMGFSGIGPVAGSAAAAFQSANGATAVFSTLQSAAMGGYGAAVVNSVVSAGSVISAAGSGIRHWFREGGHARGSPLE